MMPQYLAILDEAGDEIYVDREYYIAEWEPEVITHGDAQLAPVDGGVAIRGGARDRFVEGGELYACRDDELVFVIDEDDEILAVSKDAQVHKRGHRRADGPVIGHYVDTNGDLEAVWARDGFASGGSSCWNLEWPAEWDPGRFEGAVPRTAAMTKDGVAIHFAKSVYFNRGPLLFFAFDNSRDVAPCRRVTRRLVLP